MKSSSFLQNAVVVICTIFVLTKNCLAQSQASLPTTTVSMSASSLNQDQPSRGDLYKKRLASLIPNFDEKRGISDATDMYVAPVFVTAKSHKSITRWNPAMILQVENFSKKDIVDLGVDNIKHDQRLWQVNGNREQPLALVTPGTCIIKLPNQQFLYLDSMRWESNRTFRADDPSTEAVQVGKGLFSKKFIACGGVLADLKNVKAPYKETVYFYAMEIEAKYQMYFGTCPKGSLEGCALYKAKATLSVIAKPKDDAEYSLHNKFGPNRREYTPMAVLDLGDVVIEDQRAGQGLFTRLFTLNSPNFFFSFIAALLGCC